MSLGQCEKCYGPLCIKGVGLEERGKELVRTPPVVACERCGHPHFDHPKTKEMVALHKAQEGKPAEQFILSPKDFEAVRSNDRLAILEKQVAAQGKLIQEQAEQLKALRATIDSNRRKTG